MVILQVNDECGLYFNPWMIKVCLGNLCIVFKFCFATISVFFAITIQPTCPIGMRLVVF